MTETWYKDVDLYGGALTCLLPNTFTDVSELRQVPDNQEVYLDSEGFTSIVFDILERVEKGTDEEALKFHLSDIVEEESDVKVWATNSVTMSKLPNGTPAYTLLATSPPGSKQRGRPNEPEFVGILLTLVRLVEQKTDVIITVNVPHLAGQYDASEVDLGQGKLGALMEKGVQVREKVVGSLEVRDWGLFVQE